MKNIFTKDKDEVIVGLTSKDISVSYKKKPDWGVKGLGSVSMNACVVSTFRLKDRSELWKLVTHEFIHTYFAYGHCPKNEPECIMQDCKGHPKWSAKSKPCEVCRQRLD